MHKSKKFKLILIISSALIIIFSATLIYFMLCLKPKEATVGVLIQENDTLTDSIWNGISLATEEWNSNKSTRTKIKLEKVQHSGDTEDAKRAFNQMTSQIKPVAIIGSPYSSIVVPMIEEINASQIPYFSGGSGVAITENNTNGWIFRFRTNDNLVVKIVMKYFVNVLGKTSLAMLYTDSPYGQGANQAAINNSIKLGVPLAMSVPFNVNMSDIKNKLDSISKSGVEMLMIWATTSESQYVLNSINDITLKMPFVGSAGFLPVDQLTKFSSKNDGNYVVVDYLAKNTDKEWTDKIENKYGKRFVNFATAGYYDAANLIYNSIEKTGTNNFQIKDALKTSFYNGVVGQYKFDENGDGLRQAYIGVIKNSEIEFLKLETLD